MIFSQDGWGGEGRVPVSSKERTQNVAEDPDSLVRFVPPVRHDMDPGGVVAGQSDGHGGHGVLHDGQKLDVAQMEVVLVTKPDSWKTY